MTFHWRIAIGVDMFVPERCVESTVKLFGGYVITYERGSHKEDCEGNSCPGGLFWSLCIGELAGKAGREALLTPVGCSLLSERSAFASQTLFLLR